MVAHFNKYSNWDIYEDTVNEMLNSAWENPFTEINRKSKNGENEPQVINFPDGESYILPDITVFYDKERKKIEMRVEVKGFHQLPFIESPCRNLPLFPIKIRQLQSYWLLFSKEGIELRVVIVVGDKDYPSDYVYYWTNIVELSKMKKIEGSWKKKKAFWFNIEDMHSDFSNF